MRITIPMALMLLINTGWALDLKQADLPADPLRGAAQFTQKGCDRCHSVEGRGGTFGPDLARSDLDRSLLDIFAMMWNHSPQMSGIMTDLHLPRPSLTSTDLTELAAYIYYIDYFDKPGDIGHGTRVFTDKGCVNCHRVGGIGKAIGPDLAPIKKYVSPIFLAQMMWNHGSRIKAKMDELGIPWPQFDGPGIADLMAFLRDASPVTDPARVFMRPGNPQTGEQLFEKKGCIACHRVFGTGTAIGPDLSKSTFHRTATSISAIMWNHGPAIWRRMEELGLKRPTFEGNEMADLTAFLYFVRFLEPQGDPLRGEMLFHQKGCQNCHYFGEKGVDSSFSLSHPGADRSKVDIVAAMWNNGQPMAAMMTRMKVEWPRFGPGEVNDLVEYIRLNGNR